MPNKGKHIRRTLETQLDAPTPAVDRGIWSCPLLNDAARALYRSRLMVPPNAVWLAAEILCYQIDLSRPVSKQLVLLSAA